MSEDYRTYTRVDRFEKKRKSTQAISWLLVVSGLLVILFISLFFLGSEDDQQVQDASGNIKTGNEEEQRDEEPATETEAEVDGSTDDRSNNEEDTEPNQEENQVEQVPSEDENVEEAYTGDWQPVGTTQDEPHVITFEQESVDWIEMMKAVELATGLSSDNRIEWWVERAGDQKVIATVTNNSQTEIYRVYVSWVENQGWMPTKVEELKENDQKERFEDDE
ncbi:YrrS family protein [Aquibacillus albus]|uniref:Cytoskeletal protein RodZ n=1 Tax=Aquibacillus albus TaxID=1168171 RepID=A0ABS2MUN8_9BACI|nr:YrrS family protein [Aquibacillus albus]MBM7569579.1 cytoskeletal protein RodZ [Aquibacillus albus]